jgi:cephalosporin hydroxylase
MIKKTSQNPLEKYFWSNNERLIHKWMHYFDIYDRHFSPYRHKKVTIVEFGVYHGGSLQMWKHYFGRRARIIGIDINPECKKLEEKQVEIYIGDQEDRTFLRELR